MSKTPLITKNDGTNWHDAVPKLRTDELGASSTDWVQEGDTKAASLKVTANGTYAAASAGKYGYDYVTVSVKGGSATGTGPDGNEHTVYPDPETGKLIDEVIPSSIVVTTPPTVTTYPDGANIDLTGAVVTAYKKDGEVWTNEDYPDGIIPLSELSFIPTKAEYKVEEQEIVDPQGLNMLLVITSANIDQGGWGKRNYSPTVLGTSVMEGERYGNLLYFGAPNGLVGNYYLTMYGGELYFRAVDLASETVYYNPNSIVDIPESGGSGLYGNIGTALTYRWEKTAGARNLWDFTNVPVSTIDPDTADMSKYNGTMPETVTVSWSRVGDGAVLDATLEIYVTPGYGNT